MKATRLGKQPRPLAIAPRKQVRRRSTYPPQGNWRYQGREHYEQHSVHLSGQLWYGGFTCAPFPHILVHMGAGKGESARADGRVWGRAVILGYRGGDYYLQVGVALPTSANLQSGCGAIVIGDCEQATRGHGS